MKYIGNKTNLIDFIQTVLQKENIEYKNKLVIDLFSGTGSVTNFFLRNNCKVISCDNMTYSIAEQYRVNYFNLEPTFPELKPVIGFDSLDHILLYLNNLKGKEGYFYKNYAPNGSEHRQYFSNNNAKKIDIIRNTIESWKPYLSFEKYMFLLGILMCSADRVSNTSGTHGAFLKIWRSMALKELYLEKPSFFSKGSNIIIQDDVINCVSKYKNNDIIYLDPPYNQRQYASNFHVLESIVVNDEQELKGVSGLREYEKQKSKFCIKKLVKQEFEKLIYNSDSKYIIMSYSNEGIMSENEILTILNNKGDVKVYKYNYRRFKTNSWTSNNTNLQELLFVCKVNSIYINKIDTLDLFSQANIYLSN